ncbi:MULTISPECIES: NAD-dependent epimerase/dehydratase family protein [unclassified Lentimonas]|uniref:NAD-dependent epimerase/dehydratase family protein n=1 Tax=unclassified Lentimonas TaxID=2630993 RepID=UPI0013209CB9|nr:MULTISPECIES: NAD-dependent epimerase/dehydratase family protein [unclassified Lentimonas]CAA6691538.1 NAD(P)H steroid dehydrogenase-like protein in alkane synthesis cluster [Lentimonas sp. CC10]CAA6696192.1 NAD(P)H steroid dehydrogenase-like protein in alkane synthesis cluster [Lentimonas sp. CC19]CAA7070890.1 NAD(P)H steroid dehydrogenase-like protein in alkane synthesis cluster [Lentimonas sp. CC11]
MKILVTGGGGFVGSYVIERLLARGYSVRSIGRSAQPKLEALGVEVVCGDLTDATVVSSACEGVDAVFHVAARAGVWGSWESYYQPNVVGTRNVVAACRAQGVGRLVYTSTPSVVFNGEPIRGGDESLPYGKNWLCHYAHTKAIAEKETLAANSETLRIVALRPHLIFGPGDPHLLPRVIDSVKAGRLKIVGDGASRVDVSYVGNVADAHLDAFDALDSGKGAGQAYFISQGESVELWPWVNSILEGLGHAPLTKRIPLPVAYGVGTLCEGVWKVLGRRNDPPITRFVAVELAKDHYFDISAARRDLGYEPRVGMAEALKLTIGDLRSRGF